MHIEICEAEEDGDEDGEYGKQEKQREVWRYHEIADPFTLDTRSETVLVGQFFQNVSFLI